MFLMNVFLGQGAFNHRAFTVYVTDAFFVFHFRFVEVFILSRSTLFKSVATGAVDLIEI